MQSLILTIAWPASKSEWEGDECIQLRGLSVPTLRFEGIRLLHILGAPSGSVQGEEHRGLRVMQCCYRGTCSTKHNHNIISFCCISGIIRPRTQALSAGHTWSTRMAIVLSLLYTIRVVCLSVHPHLSHAQHFIVQLRSTTCTSSAIGGLCSKRLRSSF